MNRRPAACMTPYSIVFYGLTNNLRAGLRLNAGLVQSKAWHYYPALIIPSL